MTEFMTAIEITRFGEPDVLKPRQLPVPDIKDDELLIKVAAAGVNRPDIMQRTGMYPAPKGASEIPGLEISGEIASMGANVSGWSIGDKVCGLVAGGGYAEYCAVPASQCLPVPEGLSMAEAAALPETFFTVWSNVFDRGALKAGETFMVHGGTSGIGTAAIQMAKAFGATVITTCGSDEKAAFCRELGADLAINYKTRDFAEEVKKFTKGKGVNVLLDMIAGDYMKRNLMVMAPEGRIVMIAVQRGPKIKANILPIMLKRLTFTGSTLRARETAFKADIARNLREKVWPLIEQGKIKPVMSKSFALKQAAAAHSYLESGQNMGKIVLTVSK
ncbi:Quinone oxidoreductase [hydrothermal vent metagenome]|uniref:Quinone oxidoreductase n=1 Tax=hydrothermal vent metagenome TaxID=652676 RepID=A0A3B0R2B8_9ZZZZ